MSSRNILGALAASCEMGANAFLGKSPLVGVILFMLAGFFWTAEALLQTPPRDQSYWQNIVEKLKIRFDNTPTPSMKWALAAGMLTLAASVLSLVSLVSGFTLAGWMVFIPVGIAAAVAVSWFNASTFNTYSGTFNKLAALSLGATAVFGLLTFFAPLAILATTCTVLTYVSSSFWLLSYPLEVLDKYAAYTPVGEDDLSDEDPPPEDNYFNKVDDVEYLPPGQSPDGDDIDNGPDEKSRPPTHTQSPQLYSPHAFLGNGRPRQTFKAEHCQPDARRSSLDLT